MPRILKSRNFLIGMALGTVVGPMLLNRVAPNLKARLPG
jgi:hypothetical protein